MFSNQSTGISVKDLSVAPRLHNINANAVSRFPRYAEFKRRGKRKVRKVVKKILMALVLVGGLSVASMAQRGQDPKKPPPKQPPPVINPGKQNPPPKNGGDKPKKPGRGEAFFLLKENRIELA